MSELSSQAISIQSVYAWFDEDRLFVNRRYQRKLVWTLEEKQRLIESIQKKYPVPAILIAEREGNPGTYEIIDGLQRLHAIVSFIETAFPTLDGRHFNLDFFPSARRRADEGVFSPTPAQVSLSQKEVTNLLDYSLAISVMRNATEAEVNDVFGRINTYGHRLSDQERRHAGMQNEFSNMVRDIACVIRGDASAEILPLKEMPSISIDLPKSKHEYQVQADEVLWVNQGILRSTDLRDSVDEQCIADIAASIVGGTIIERSKDALDEIYSTGSAESARIASALKVYGAEKFAEEFKYCLDELIKVCSVDPAAKLSTIIFKQKTNNAFPSVFATLLFTLHELIVKEGNRATDYEGIRKAITHLNERIETNRGATVPDERRKNVDQVKGLISKFFVKANPPAPIYGNHATTDIETAIRRSEVELPTYELKQGMLMLSNDRKADAGVIEKVIQTICAIANNGPNSVGKIIIGVTNKPEDAARIKQLDKIDARPVGKRFVVGVAREAKTLGISMEKYLALWQDAIRNSGLSQGLRDAALSHIDFNEFYGFGIIVITVPAQKELSYVGDDLFWRNADSTERATNPKQIEKLAKRF